MTRHRPCTNVYGRHGNNLLLTNELSALIKTNRFECVCNGSPSCLDLFNVNINGHVNERSSLTRGIGPTLSGDVIGDTGVVL